HARPHESPGGVTEPAETLPGRTAFGRPGQQRLRLGHRADHGRGDAFAADGRAGAARLVPRPTRLRRGPGEAVGMASPGAAPYARTSNRSGQWTPSRTSLRWALKTEWTW